MAVINGSIPSLIQGISQQPYQTRLPTQGEEQINGISSLVDGLGKRPCTQFVSKFSSNGYVKPFCHFVNRDEFEQYVILFYPTNIAVADKDGVQYPVVPATADVDMSYIATSQPYRYIKALTVADTTFVLNRSVATKLTQARTPVRTNEAIVWIRAGTYDTDYTIKISNTAVTVNPGPTDPTHVKTTWIADQLATGMASALGSSWAVTRYNNAIWFRRNDGNDFSITTSDSAGNNNHRLIKGEVQRFSDLPPDAPSGYICKVRGEVESTSDDYYVEFQTNTGVAFGPGVWVEATAPNSKYEIDYTLMPHQLVRKQDDEDGTVTGKPLQIYFEWGYVRWAYRNCGGDEIPAPSFLGYPLADIFIHRNRLGFLTRSSCVLSQAGNLTNFWRQTALSLLDDDTIDVQISHTRAVNLRHAVAFNDDLLLFSDRTQFTLKGGEILSPKTVSAPLATEYSSHIDCIPANAENMVYFPFDNGDYTGIREYYTDPATNQKDAKTVTEHCPRYLRGSALRLAVSPTSDMLIVTTDAERNFVYVYQWYWNGTEKIQNAWHKWDFGNGATVISCGYLGDDLYVVLAYPDGTFIERMELAPNAADALQEYPIQLDRRVGENTAGVSASYDALSDRTTISLPYILDGSEAWAVVSHATDDSSWYPARRATVLSVSANRIVVDGDLRKGFFAGRIYPFVYQFSPAFLHQQSPMGGLTSVREGRLQILDWEINYSRSGYFRCEVTPFNRDTATYEYTGQTLLVPKPGTGLGDVQIRDGSLKFKVLSKNDQVVIKIVNDSHLPSFFAGAEWVADYTTKTRRV